MGNNLVDEIVPQGIQAAASKHAAIVGIVSLMFWSFSFSSEFKIRLLRNAQCTICLHAVFYHVHTHNMSMYVFRTDEMEGRNEYIGEQQAFTFLWWHALIVNAALDNQISFAWSNSQVFKFYLKNICCIPMHLDTCAQVRGSEVTHQLYASVPKLIISSNSIRLLNVVGQGNLCT